MAFQQWPATGGEKADPAPEIHLPTCCGPLKEAGTGGIGSGVVGRQAGNVGLLRKVPGRLEEPL